MAPLSCNDQDCVGRASRIVESLSQSPCELTEGLSTEDLATALRVLLRIERQSREARSARIAAPGGR